MNTTMSANSVGLPEDAIIYALATLQKAMYHVCSHITLISVRVEEQVFEHCDILAMSMDFVLADTPFNITHDQPDKTCKLDIFAAGGMKAMSKVFSEMLQPELHSSICTGAAAWTVVQGTFQRSQAARGV